MDIILKKAIGSVTIMEALGAASAVAGVLSIGIEVCQGLLKYYNSYRGAATDIARMFESVESLNSTLLILKRTLSRGTLPPEIAEDVLKSIKSCESGFEKLEKKLKKVKTEGSGQSGWQEKAKNQLKRAAYPFRESTLVKLREIVNEQRSHLSLAVSVLHMWVDLSLSSRLSLATIGNLFACVTSLPPLYGKFLPGS